MLFDYRGNGGFGYDPLFLYEPMDKTFAEMNAEEKNAISHRARAMEKFARIFTETY
jgi:XTP/dITP diphosphohydrolase